LSNPALARLGVGNCGATDKECEEQKIRGNRFEGKAFGNHGELLK
jgi:hypothetical protein